MVAEPPVRGPADLEDLEIDLLLEGVHRVYGMDFRDYARASVRRRLRRRVREEGLATVSALQDKVLHDPACMSRLLLDLSVSVTSMFRDPPFYRAIVDKVVPALRTYAFVRIWNAGCATGEETWSLAILLREHGLGDRTRIYATDMNPAALDRAKSGELTIGKIPEYAANYAAAGGTGSLAAYFTSSGGTARLRPSLVDDVVFAQHNLVLDGSFNEFNLIVCRNVLIYFERPLQERVHALLHESLAMFGVLALGPRETLGSTALEHCYQPLDPTWRLYRKLS